MILVTGATGNVGKELVKKLSTRGERVRAFVRSRSETSAIALPGVEFFEGDFNDFSSFVTALTGVDRLFLLIPSSPDVERQQKEFVDVAQQKGVRHMVYLWQLGADEHSTKGASSGITGQSRATFESQAFPLRSCDRTYSCKRF